MEYIKRCNCIKSSPFTDDDKKPPHCNLCGKDYIKPISSSWMCSSNIN